MQRRAGLLSVVVTGLALLAFIAPAGGAGVALPTEMTASGVRWGDFTQDTTGFYNEANPCSFNITSEAFAMGDALLLANNQTDAFDDAGAIRLAGSTDYWTAPGGTGAPVDVTGTTLTTPSGPLGAGLNVVIQWRAMTTSPTIRELVSITNSSGATVTQRVRMDFNFGSDDTTNLYMSSTGDETWTTADRWVATADSDDPTDYTSNPSGFDPPILSVLYGPGSPESPLVALDNCGDTASPSAVAEENKGSGGTKSTAEPTTTTSTVEPEVDVPDLEVPEATDPGDTVPAPDIDASQTELPPCNPGGNVGNSCDQWSTGFDVTIPAGETRYLMFFWALYQTPGGAVAAGAAFNANPADSSELLAGIDNALRPLIVNWDLPLIARFTG